MTRDYVTLRLEFVRLQQDVERFADRLRDAEQALRESGELDGEIENDLSQHLHNWDTLEHELGSTGDETEATGPEELPKLSLLKEKLDRLQRRERAALVLRGVREIRYTDGTDSSELQNVHHEMQVLEGSLDDSESEPTIEHLVKGTHPANALLSLVRDGDRLSDKEWAALQETVGEAYGATIATAAVRGRLTGQGFAICHHHEASSIPAIDGQPGVAAGVSSDRGSSDEMTCGGVAANDASVEQDDVKTGDVAAVDSTVEGSAEWASNVDVGFLAIHVEEREHEDSVEGAEAASLPPKAGKQDAEVPPLSLLEAETLLSEEASLSLLRMDDSSDGSIFDEPEEVVELQGPALVKERSIEWEELRAAAIHTDSALEVPSNDPVPPQSGERALALPKTYQIDHGPIQKAAHSAINGSPLYRDRHVSDVILHLAADDRLGLAVSMARGQEARGELPVPFLPSWLLEAMAMAPHVTFVRGRLAAMVEASLSHCHERVWHDLSEEWREGMGFFVRAATLRPSVVSPGTRAAAILRSFSLNADCTELYNYCSRIATFGERLQGLMPALFTQRQSHLSREGHLLALQAEVSHWSEMLVERSIGYTQTDQLFLHANWSVKSGSAVRHSLHARRWQKWQQTLRLSEKIIKPVREADSEQVPKVKAEIRRLSAILREGSCSPDERDTDGDGLIRIPHPAMKNVLREAMAYAQRWVSLHSSTAEEADFFLPQAAEELRDEVVDRHDAVVRELETVRERSDAKVVIAGVTCLLRSVHQLREMVDPCGPVNPIEADPRHLLSGELLKIPGVRLDDRWEPPMDELATQTRILRFLVDPQPDWETAFQMRCESGDRIATERLLELDVWESHEQKDALREVRDQYIQPTRASLMSELMHFERRLQIIANEEQRADDQLELEQRLQRLRDSLAESSDTVTTTTIEWCRQELSALRTGFRSLRCGEPSLPFSSPPEARQGLPDDHLQH